MDIWCTHTHTRLTALCPGLPGWASIRKVKQILLKQETVSGSGISWAICKSPCSRQITVPAPHHSVFLQAGCPSTQPTASKHWRQIYDKYLIIKHRRFSVTVKLIFPHKNKCLVYDAIQQTNKYSPEASNQPPALHVYQYHHDQWLLGSTIIHNKTQRITENTQQCNITQQTTTTTTTTPV